MNNQGSCPAHFYSVDPGEATTGGGGDDGGAESFLGMFGDRHSSGDLFDLVWQGGAGGGGSGSTDVVQPSHHPSLPAAAASVAPPPWEDDEMAAWLYPAVRGDELGFTGRQGDQPGSLAGHAAAAAAAADDQQREDKLPKAEEKCRTEHPTQKTSSLSLRKKATGGARKSHSAETHSLTEKRRRCKINAKFKTLQQLVPGCDKSNQVSTLDRTIRYMKSLQQQIQAMPFGCGVKPAAVVYPVVPPAAAAAAGLMPAAAAAAAAPGPGVVMGEQVRPWVVLAQPPVMVGPLLPVHHHQNPAAAMAPPLYPAGMASPNLSVVVASSSQRHTENLQNSCSMRRSNCRRACRCLAPILPRDTPR